MTAKQVPRLNFACLRCWRLSKLSSDRPEYEDCHSQFVMRADAHRFQHVAKLTSRRVRGVWIIEWQHGVTYVDTVLFVVCADQVDVVVGSVAVQRRHLHLRRDSQVHSSPATGRLARKGDLLLEQRRPMAMPFQPLSLFSSRRCKPWGD